MSEASRTSLLRFLLPAVAMVLVRLPGAACGQEAPAYRNSALAFELRVADLIARMTLEEKAVQMFAAAPANDRLGIPACNWWTEALHGISRGGPAARSGAVAGGADGENPNAATVFPEAIGMAATWNPPLIQRITTAISDEARARFDPAGVRGRGLMLWCPTINLARDPRWGRTQETFGEDPYLASRLAVAYVRGLQGDDPRYLKTVATPKHFVVYNQEASRASFNAVVSQRALREYYLAPFHAALVEGGAASIMGAYNAVNGVPCCANTWALSDLLRGEWKFSGAVVSDASAVRQLVSGHRLVATQEEAIAAAINAGLDVITDGNLQVQPLLSAVSSGLLSEGVLDRALARNLMLRFRLGMFDPPEMVPFAGIPASVVGCKAHQELALQAARQTVVLLRNDPAPRGFGFEKLLPLDLRRIESIAVVGPFARSLEFGSYGGTPANAAPTPVEALTAALGDRIRILTATSDYDAPRIAQGADLTLAFYGGTARLAGGGVDRATLDLPPDQRETLDKVLRANPLTILVLQGGNPLTVDWARRKVPAIVMTWYNGEQGANALVEILLGQTNPAGRLPITFYRDTADLPPMTDYELAGRTHMYLDKPVTFAFGHGLSYTDFDYGKLTAAPETALPRAHSPGASVEFQIAISNIGQRDGDEVVQLYARELSSQAPRIDPEAIVRPVKKLVAFERVSIPKGESRTVRLVAQLADLARWDSPSGRFVVDAGRWEFLAGASSEDIRARISLDLQ